MLLGDGALTFESDGPAVPRALGPFAPAVDGSDDVEARVTGALQARSWDCVIVGGGIRTPEEQLELFESIINLVRRHAPQATIAFNRTPHDLADAAARSLRHNA